MHVFLFKWRGQELSLFMQNNTHLFEGILQHLPNVTVVLALRPNPCDSRVCLSQCEEKLSPHLKMAGMEKHLLENDPTLQGFCSCPIIQSQRQYKGVDADDLPLDAMMSCVAPAHPSHL